jgi:hypothetical protein
MQAPSPSNVVCAVASMEKTKKKKYEQFAKLTIYHFFVT